MSIITFVFVKISMTRESALRNKVLGYNAQEKEDLSMGKYSPGTRSETQTITLIQCDNWNLIITFMFQEHGIWDNVEVPVFDSGNYLHITLVDLACELFVDFF